MAGSADIKNRIKGIQDTRKITNAMYLISSTKLRRAKKSMEDIEPYFYGLQSLMQRMMRHFPDMTHPYLRGDEERPESETTHGFLVVTADKGLAGSYNANVLKETGRLMKGKSSRLYVVGEAGRRFFEQRKISIEENFTYTVQNPTRARARVITNTFLKDFEEEKIHDLTVVFTAMKNSLETETRVMKLMPLEKEMPLKDIPSDVPREEFIIHPSPKEVLSAIIPPYVAGLVYSALVESYCCEQNSRMQAMRAANDSADEIVQELKVRYNRKRQAGITQEITEVSAGARSGNLHN
ncbi:MAG: ATP synthase F1 subunit gamma [Lachnospiraceae bacterium]|nr:ATP synthase F1 subunit gamma [Lachnospiraceae bacterium]